MTGTLNVYYNYINTIDLFSKNYKMYYIVKEVFYENYKWNS